MNQLIDLMKDQRRYLDELSSENQNLIAENSSLRDELEFFRKSNESKDDVALFIGSEKDRSNSKTRLSQLIEKVDQCIEDFSRIMYQTVA